MEPLVYFGLVFAGFTGLLALRVRNSRLDNSYRPKRTPTIDPALDAKLLSIENGEKNGAQTLSRICLSRSTPDLHRARALRMLADRVDPSELAPILHSVSRACGRLTCAELFRHAALFPNPVELETAALTVLRNSWYDDLRLAALRALLEVGTHRSLAVLGSFESKRTVPVYLRRAAAQARLAIASKHPHSDDLRGAVSETDSDSGALSFPDDSSTGP